MTPPGDTGVPRWLGIVLGGAVGEGERRFRAVARGAASAVGARALALAISFVSVPLAVAYLGTERYGAWVTITSVLLWLYVADLGIGNALTNALSGLSGEKRAELGQDYVASSFWALVALSVALGLGFSAAWPFIDWATLVNVAGERARSEMAVAVAVAVALFLASFPLTVLERIYLSFQEGALANAWAVTDSMAGFLALLGATRTRGGLIALVAAVSGSHLAVSLANGAWLFWRHRPELRPAIRRMNAAAAHRLASSAREFFAVQVIGVLLFSTDNVILARVNGAAAVTPYSIAFKLFSLAGLYVTLHTPYLWPAYSEARARGDAGWIRRAHFFSVASSAGVALVLAVFLGAFGGGIIRIWAGPAAVPTRAVLWWMAAWAVISAPATAASSLLSALGELRVQLYFGALAACANIALSILWARLYGPAGVIAGTVVSYTVCAALPVGIAASRTLRRLSRAPP